MSARAAATRGRATAKSATANARRGRATATSARATVIRARATATRATAAATRGRAARARAGRRPLQRCPPLLFRLLISLILTPLCAAPAWADPHPNTQGGVDVNQVFQLGNVDNINLFNGSLTVSLPLGLTYPVGGSFNYHLMLVANSNPWGFLQKLPSS